MESIFFSHWSHFCLFLFVCVFVVESELVLLFITESEFYLLFTIVSEFYLLFGRDFALMQPYYSTGFHLRLVFARQTSLVCSQGSQVCFVVRKAVKFVLLFARKSSHVYCSQESRVMFVESCLLHTVESKLCLLFVIAASS